jgi:hypothetical protein
VTTIAVEGVFSELVAVDSTVCVAANTSDATAKPTFVPDALVVCRSAIRSTKPLVSADHVTAGFVGSDETHEAMQNSSGEVVAAVVPVDNDATEDEVPAPDC